MIHFFIISFFVLIFTVPNIFPAAFDSFLNALGYQSADAKFYIQANAFLWLIAYIILYFSFDW